MALEQDRHAQRWLESSDPAIGVGARHHTVPAFYLRRFANSDGRLLVRDRPTGRLFPSTASKLAIKDFYTVVNQDGTFDGRMEQLLAKVEGEAAQLLKLLLSPYRKPGPLTQAEQVTLCQFVAFQMVRGPRKRREVELQADYAAKLQAGDELTEQDLREITAVPHPNEHIRLMGPVSFAIFDLAPERMLPLLEGLADRTLAGEFEPVVCLEAPELVDVPESLRRSDGLPVYRRHMGAKYATAAARTRRRPGCGWTRPPRSGRR